MAKGSHSVFAGYPRVCQGCGQPVVMSSRRPLWFETRPPGPPTSWHWDCRHAAINHANHG